MKKLHIIIAGIVYLLLFCGILYHSLFIKPKLNQTPLMRGLISKEGADPRIRVTHRIIHDVNEKNTQWQTMDIREGETILELIKRTHPTETINTLSGIDVTSIDGKTNTADTLWKLFINEQPATMSASAYAVKQHDAIEWRFEMDTETH